MSVRSNGRIDINRRKLKKIEEFRSTCLSNLYLFDSRLASVKLVNTEASILTV
jgi:hypothetical protein